MIAGWAVNGSAHSCPLPQGPRARERAQLSARERASCPARLGCLCHAESRPEHIYRAWTHKHTAKHVRRMGAKLSRRKSDGATGTEGVAAEAAAQQKPATESGEQKPAEAELESKPTEQTPGVDSSPSEPAPGDLEAIPQAVEEAVSSVSEQIVAPVEGVGAVEPMMAAISIKDEPVAPPPESPSEPLDSSIPNPPEDAVPQSDESSPLEDLLTEPEPLLPEPILTATVEDDIPLTGENEAEIDAQESFECNEMGMTQDEAAPEGQLSNLEL